MVEVVSDEYELPLPLRGHDTDVPYTRQQLAATRARLQYAVHIDLGEEETPTAQQLAAAWSRVAELRLPRQAVPNAVLEVVEDLVTWWDTFGYGGLSRCAYSLSPEERRMEAMRIEAMLATVTECIHTADDVASVPSDD
jgi:hypothetical protein